MSSDAERSRTKRLDVPLVGSFGVPSKSVATTGRNGRIGHGNIHDGCVEQGELRGHHGHPVPRPAMADLNSDSIMIDGAHTGLEADVRGESYGMPGMSMNIAGNEPPRGHTTRFDANIGAGVGLGTEVNSEGSPVKRRRTIRFADEV